MKFTSLSLINFRSFKSKQAFVFPKGAGFYLLIGINNENKSLGPNGVGKSSLWDALSFVLYGRTPRGLGGTEITTRNAKGPTEVELVFEAAGTQQTILRTHKPNSLMLNGQETTQEEIDKLLQLGPDEFAAAALKGQFAKTFLDFSPADKLKAFSTVLNLEIWEDLAQTSSKQCATAENQHQTTTSKIQTITASQTILTRENQDNQERSVEWEIEKQETEKTILKELNDLEDKKHQLKKTNFEVDKTTYRKIRAEVSENERILTDIDNERLQLQREMDRTKDQISRVERDVQKINNASSTCPTCGAPLDKRHKDREILELNKTRDDLRNKLAVLDVQFAKIKTQSKPILDKATALDQQLVQINKEMAVADHKVAEHQTKINDLTRQITTLNRKLDEQKENPYTAKIKNLTSEIESNAASLIILEKEQKVAEWQITSRGFWTKEFRNLRLWLVESALQEFEVETNLSLLELGLSGWSVKYACERITQAGTVSRGFTVTILPPEERKDVKWETFSGGETQRLRVAAAVGLGNLVRARTGINPSIEVWDEPTQHLSEEGVSSLLAFFSDRARSENRQIWLVDHHSHSAGDFDGIYCVVKDKNGSIIHQEQ